MSFIYLASPYTHRDPEVVQARFEAVEALTARLVRRGHVVYSPIVHSHVLADKYGLPQTSEFWRIQNYGMLAAASELWVLAMIGLRESVGVADEIRFASQCRIPIQKVTQDGTARGGIVVGSDGQVHF